VDQAKPRQENRRLSQHTLPARNLQKAKTGKNHRKYPFHNPKAVFCTFISSCFSINLPLYLLFLILQIMKALFFHKKNEKERQAESL
jgi:hypothetical protein